MRNIFQKLIAEQDAADMRLGKPFSDGAQRDRTMAAMAYMTGGKGFRTPPKEPRTRDGKTRGDRKREARDIANAKVSEYRPVQFLHSSRTIKSRPFAARGE